MKKILSLMFLIVGVLSAVAFNIVRYTLPLNVVVLLKIVPTLMMSAWIVVMKPDRRTLVVLIGLLFSMIGDLFMELPGEPAFILGIGTNTLGVVFYALYFFITDKSRDLVRLVPPAIVMGVFYIILHDFTKQLAIPVLVYCIIHTLFLWRASVRFGKPQIRVSAQWVCFIGCVCVTISDFLLSLTLFGIIPNAVKYQVIDMILWWSGLFLLAVTAVMDGKPEALPAQA